MPTPPLRMRPYRDGFVLRLAMLLLLLPVLAVLAGCGEPSGPPVDAVNAYLEGLPTALHGDTLDPLRPYATPDQLDRVRRYVSMLLFEGGRVEATLVEHSVRGVDQEDGRAYVETDERWRMVTRDSETGAVVSEERYDVRMRYEVVQAENGWLVADVVEVERR